MILRQRIHHFTTGGRDRETQGSAETDDRAESAEEAEGTRLSQRGLDVSPACIGRRTAAGTGALCALGDLCALGVRSFVALMPRATGIPRRVWPAARASARTVTVARCCRGRI